MDKNFTCFCLKLPRNRFSEKHISGPFLQNRLPYLFSRQNELCRAFWGKIVRDENIARLSLKQHRNHFSKKHVSGSFLRNRPHHLFPGPNGLCGAFRGKFVMDKKFTRFCLKRPRNCFFPKNTFPVPLYETAPLTYFWGQTDYVAHFEAKLLRTKTSLAYA